MDESKSQQPKPDLKAAKTDKTEKVEAKLEEPPKVDPKLSATNRNYRLSQSDTEDE